MPLTDLDELTLRCRDAKTRQLLAEAVASYKAGAYRASIVSCWVAVCFDLIEKFRELEFAGDSNAQKVMANLDKIRAEHNLSAALGFERDILETAADKFELISPLNKIDLKRLQDDRNRCAHPSFLSDDSYYEPPAELARLHLFNAVEHVMQHPPVQGKHALERILKEISSEYFPNKRQEAMTSLSSGPLRRPKDSLVRAVVFELVRQILGDLPPSADRRSVAALCAIAEMHREPYENFMRDKFSILVRALNDGDLVNAVRLIVKIPNAWWSLEDDIKSRVENFVYDLPKEKFGLIEDFYHFQPLREKIVSRIRRARKKEISDTFFFDVPSELVDKVVWHYEMSKSFEQANEWSHEVIRFVGDFTIDQARQVVKIAGNNPEIKNSFKLDSVLAKIKSANLVVPSEYDEWLIASGLEDFIEIPF